MYKYYCLNPIAKIGLNQFDTDYVAVDKMENAENDREAENSTINVGIGE